MLSSLHPKQSFVTPCIYALLTSNNVALKTPVYPFSFNQTLLDGAIVKNKKRLNTDTILVTRDYKIHVDTNYVTRTPTVDLLGHLFYLTFKVRLNKVTFMNCVFTMYQKETINKQLTWIESCPENNLFTINIACMPIMEFHLIWSPRLTFLYLLI